MHRPTSVMEACKKEKRGVVIFLTAVKVGERDICRRMSAVYGDNSILCLGVLEDHKRFREGHCY